MTRLNRYILAELLPPLLAGTLLFTSLLTFGYFFVSSQWLTGVPPALVGEWLALQVPDTLVKVLPMAAVLMTVVAFGRLSAGRELVAMQAGGVGLSRAARPVAGVGAVLAALGVWLSLWVAPETNVQARALYWDTLTGAGLSTMTGRTIDLGGGLSVRWQGYDLDTGQMSQVRAERWDVEDLKRVDVIFAEAGKFEGNTLRLSGYQVFTTDYAAAAALAQLIEAGGSAEDGPENSAEAVPANPLALRAQLEELNKQVAEVFPAVVVSPPKTDWSSSGAEGVANETEATGASGGDDLLAEADTPPPMLELKTETGRAEALAQFADAIGADAAGWADLRARMADASASEGERAEAALTLSRKLALPLGNLVLALAALPFALRFGRSLGVSLGLALVASLAYYLLTALGLTLAASGTGALRLAWPWLGNAVMLLLGAWALRRA